MWLSISLLFVLCSCTCLCYRFLEDAEQSKVPFFPAEYRVAGEIISVISQIVTPFEAWYSSEYNKSRIDYFDGMVKNYYYAETEDYEGQAFEIHPITNQTVTNEMICYKTTHEGEQTDFLPNLEGFKFIDHEEINGQSTEKWTRTDDSEDDLAYKVEETLWMRSIDRDGQAVPVRYEEKVFNKWLGDLETHTIKNYYHFEATVESEDLEVEEDVQCKCQNVKKGDLSTLAFVDPRDEQDVNIVFTQFKGKHSRQYADKREHETKRTIFRRNLEKVLTTNHKRLGYKLTLNKFADRSEEELRYLKTLRPSRPDAVGTILFPYEENEIDKLADEFPKEFDMRLDGIITPVQSQELCGSCWAFALTAGTEGAIARSNGGRALRLSPQALVDCAWGYENDGCDGGELDGGFYFILKHGLPTDEDYGPYLDMDGYCRIQDMPKVQSIKGFTKVMPLSKNAIKVALYNHGPVIVGMQASDDMTLYSGGVFYDESCGGNSSDSINHAVTIVGYGVKNSETYWIVKNSWGQDWGSGGYFLMSTKNNNCFIESEPYYAVV